MMFFDEAYVIRAAAELRELYGPPLERSVRKEMDHLDEHARAFVARSPLVILGTSGVDGADNSPRGDMPGFVKVADERTLLIPDRRGNNRLDALQNILRNPQVGLLFLVPGATETFRVNGEAFLTRDPAVTGLFTHQGKTPRTVIVVRVQQAYIHCSRALLRADVWNTEKFVKPGGLPSFGTVMQAHTRGFVDATAVDEENKLRLPVTLY
jgi:hypothetical protein